MSWLLILRETPGRGVRRRSASAQFGVIEPCFASCCEAFFKVNEERKFRFRSENGGAARRRVLHRLPSLSCSAAPASQEAGHGAVACRVRPEKKKRLPLTLRLLRRWCRVYGRRSDAADLRKLRDDRGAPLKWSLRRERQERQLCWSTRYDLQRREGLARVGIRRRLRWKARRLFSNVALVVGTCTFH